MSSNRVKKCKRQRKQEKAPYNHHIRLAESLNTFNSQMSPYTYYQTKSLLCQVAAQFNNYGKYQSASMPSSCNTFSHSNKFIKGLIDKKKELDTLYNQAVIKYYNSFIKLQRVET